MWKLLSCIPHRPEYKSSCYIRIKVCKDGKETWLVPWRDSVESLACPQPGSLLPKQRDHTVEQGLRMLTENEDDQCHQNQVLWFFSPLCYGITTFFFNQDYWDVIKYQGQYCILNWNHWGGLLGTGACSTPVLYLQSPDLWQTEERNIKDTNPCV